MTYDALIVGTGPAGTTAGVLLARKGLRVALVDQERFPRQDAGIGWVGPPVTSLFEETGANAKGVLVRPINNVQFFNAELTKSAKPELSDAPGYVIDRAAFENALIEAAVAAGAEILHECTVTDIVVREDEVDLQIKGRDTITGRIILLAAARSALGGLAQRVGLGTPAPADGLWAAHLDVPSASSGPKNKHAVNIVWGLTPNGGFGICLAWRKRMTVAVNVPGTPEEATVWLVSLCRALAEKGLVPPGLDGQIDRAVVVPPSPGALEMDSHVGKRALLIGEAGGFVSAASNEGVVPGMWSAKIAAEVAEAALNSQGTQDELMTFDTRWRLEMGDYLRPPNTDMQFLVPLIFSNQPMANRMAAAFFLGENI